MGNRGKVDVAARRYQIARKAADNKLHAHANVVGSCFGIKKKDGQRTGQLCVTVFVRKKVGLARLKTKDRIPSEVRRHGIDLPTDVIVIGDLRKELGFAITSGAGTQTPEKGTLSAFGRTPATVVGMSCAHCLESGGVLIEFPARTDFLDLGTTSTTAAFPGTGVSPDFGDFDAGLVQISSPPVLNYINTRPPLSVYRPPDSVTPSQLSDLLNYTPVQGWGAGTNNLIRGLIGGALVNFPPYRFDLMVEAISGQGLTSPGDSGMLWIGPSGQAMAIHMMGDTSGPNNSSLNAFGCFAFRAADRFNVSLLGT
jgi:hypothetical protein